MLTSKASSSAVAVASCSHHVARPARFLHSDRIRKKPSSPEYDKAGRQFRDILHRVVKAAVFGNQKLPESAGGQVLRAAYRDHGFQATPRRGKPTDVFRLNPERRQKRRDQISQQKTWLKERAHRRSFATSTVVKQLLSEQAVELDDEEVGGIAGLSRLSGRRERAIAPGDLVEARSNNGTALCLIVGHDLYSQLVALRQDGTHDKISPNNITFVYPNFVPSHIAAQLALPQTHEEEDVERSYRLRHQYSQRIRDFDMITQEETRLLVDRGARDMHRALASAQYATLDADKALRILRVVPTSSMTAEQVLARRFAMQRLLLEDSQHYVADQKEFRTSGEFDVRPAREVDELEIVRDWYRNRSLELQGFVTRASAALTYGESNPSKFDAAEGSTLRLQSTGLANWTGSDLKILEFLRRALESKRLIQSHPYMTIAPSIVKLVDTSITTHAVESSVDEPAIERAQIMRFLSRIGAVAPWENWALQSVGHAFKDWDKATIPTTSRAAVVDPHDPVRRDFGSTSVYTIDDAGAQELDDGISIEKAPPTSAGLPSWWVHVHVADPTAVLHPSDTVAVLARSRGNTEYLPERTYSMLPDQFLASAKLSLGSGEGQEQRVLTFSTRIDDAGSIIESDVQASVIKVVHRLTYDAVDNALGGSKSAPTTLYSEIGISAQFDFSSRSSRHTNDDVLAIDAEVQADLKQLHRLSKAVLRQRAKHAFYWFTPTAQASVFPSLTPNFTTPTVPTFYHNSPLVSIRLPSRHGDQLSGSQLLVSEMMVLANRTAARFAISKGLPMAFRSQPKPDVSEAALEAALAFRNPETGEVPASVVIRHAIEFPAGRTTLEPESHWPMGIAHGYLTATSPLRRYQDMLAHWQIKSALLPGHASPPFSRDAMAIEAASVDALKRTRGRVDRHSNSFWSLYVLQKKLSLSRTAPEKDPVASQILDNLTGVAVRPEAFVANIAAWRQRIYIPELGVTGLLTRTSEEAGLALGDSAPIKISRIELSERSAPFVELK